MWLVVGLFILLALGLAYFFCYSSYWRIFLWRRRLNLSQHQTVFNQLYQSVDGFALSLENKRDKNSVELIYGEIHFESFIALLDCCKVDNNSVFYDLGSGAGKAVLACAMVFNPQKSIGIEILENLYQCAQNQRTQLHQLKPYTATNITFIHANFMDKTIDDATIIFINSTAFIGDYWLSICNYLTHIKPGAYVISASKEVRLKEFTLVKETFVYMSWGIAKIFIQQRNCPTT